MSAAAGRVPSSGWYVEIVHPDGNVLSPQVDDGATPRPKLKGLPKVELPVDRDDKWLDDAFDRATIRVWQDGTRVPVETLIDRTHRDDSTVLTARGGDELTKRIERNVVEQESHTFVGNLVSSETSLATHVDTPINTTIVNSPLLSADTSTELTDALQEAIAPTDPIEASGSEIRLLDSCWVFEGEDSIITGEFSDASYSGGKATGIDSGISSAGDKGTWSFTPEYDVPASAVAVNIRADFRDGDGTGTVEPPEFEIRLNGSVLFNGQFLTSTTGIEWNDFSTDNEYNGPDLQAGSEYTLTIEVTDGTVGDADDRINFDVPVVYDNRFSYTWDNSVDANGYLSGPERKPDQWDVIFGEIPAVQSVSGGRIEVTMDDTSGNQQLALSVDDGSTWSTASNTSTFETDFASLGNGLTARVRLSRYGSQSGSTPTSGVSGQSLDVLDLFADLDTTPLVSNQAFDGEIVDVVNTVADDANAIWELVWDDSIGGLAFEWTQPGQRTASGDPSIIDFEVAIDSSSVNEKAVVYGTSRAVRDEEITADLGTPAALDNQYNQPGQVSIRSKSDGTEYTLGVDYEYNALAGKVTALSGGAIADGETLLVDYQARVRGEYSLPSWSGDETLATTRTIPNATTDQSAAQAAYVLVQQTHEPITTATVTIDKRPAGWSLIDAVSLADLPAPAMEIWSLKDKDGQVMLQLGSRDRVEDVVSRLQSRLESTANKV
ncbi:fibronectin type III domain-containing protein [Haloferax elongans ATCC BAA-1513]|uniref:Fibronectin type III domain-containing protein n=1 Tax=Haloferax elongans ATCC BAA-1513 TaxID=1230453 RepID=M0HKZ5_HALEO|nr:hypothetical protein [Haloferax elongans]ELZ84397.1 fibronectin type III domain-containing protein [Haloferax elongans ATCC BAA-1513]